MQITFNYLVLHSLHVASGCHGNVLLVVTKEGVVASSWRFNSGSVGLIIRKSALNQFNILSQVSQQELTQFFLLRDPECTDFNENQWGII